MKRTILAPVVNALKGSLIGVANTIPGVSGGTIAVITGLYDELIAGLSGFFRTGWKKNLAFLLPVAVGIGIGVGLFARAVDYFMQNFPDQTAYFFMGLILGSIPFLVRLTLKERFRLVYLLPFLVTLAGMLVMGIAGRPPMSEPITTLTPAGAVLIFVTGIISAATMVIPGVSGSFVLLLIGMYSTFIRAVRDINVPLLAVMVPGLVVGIVGVSKLVNCLLSRYHAVTYWAIIGLVLGSVVAIWPKTGDGRWVLPDSVLTIGTGVGALVAGFLLAYFLGTGKRAAPAAEEA